MGLDKQNGPDRVSSDQGLDRSTSIEGETIMSITMSENSITVREFSKGDVWYTANGDLGLQLRDGQNESGDAKGGIVLVKLNLDGGEVNAVEVERADYAYAYGSEREVDVIEAAIASLIVARDALRSMSVAA